MPQATISLGSNKGDRYALMREAFRRIQALGVIVRFSSIMETKPWGFTADTDFLNQIVVLETQLSPLDLLDELQRIEADLGKDTHSPTQGYASRTMDLDILYYDDLKVHSERLILPHPRIQERDFIGQLLREIAPLQ